MAALTSYTHDGLTFDVEDGGGEGEVVVLLHGFPQTGAAWRTVSPALIDAGFRTLAPDQRGYSPGARPPRRRDYAMDLLVGDVLALADAAGADRFHLVGHDWGGAVAWSVADRHPDRLASLTSLTTPHPAAMRRALFTSRQVLQSAYMPFFLLPKVPEAMFRSERGGRRVREAFEGAGLPPADAGAALAMLRAGALTPALNWYRGIPLSGKGPGPSTVPTLYVWASDDVALGQKAAEGTAAFVTGPYRYVPLQGAGHFLLEEAPDRVAELLLEHLAAHPASAGSAEEDRPEEVP
jgi:pimeloyl-ACP methyl ester carboxylesterase